VQAMDFAAAKEKLQVLRRNGARNPEEVRKCVDVVLKSRGSLGDQVWVVLEQDCTAACDMHDIKRAEQRLTEIEARFGKEGTRSMLLRGMLAEVKEDWPQAEKIYKDVKEKDETLPTVRKRLVALNKARNRIEGAVVELQDYLDIWMTDAEGWTELANLYIAADQHKHAAFCYEELILLQPYNYAYHLKYAELQYTIGGHENVELALKHYQQSLDLKTDNVQALYGIYLCTAILSVAKKSSTADKERATKLMHFARTNLDAAYVKSADKGQVMTECLNALAQ